MYKVGAERKRTGHPLRYPAGADITERSPVTGGMGLSGIERNTIYMVGNMREPIQRAVIELYYLALRKDGQLMRFEDVAKTLHYQTDSVKKIHGQALKGFYEANKKEIDTWIHEKDTQE